MFEHTEEVFHDAVYNLARRGEWQSRLCWALVRLDGLPPKELPPEIRRPFKELWRQMSGAQPVGDEGAIKAMIREMTEDSYEQYVQRILGMYEKVIVWAAKANKEA